MMGKFSAKDIRRRILDMAYRCGRSVHVGGSLSLVEILTVLYRDVMHYDFSNPTWDLRDRFLLSKGHCILAQYAVLAECGVLSDDDVDSYMQDGSILGSHPVMDVSRGIECSSGSLGQGVSMAVGIAKAAKLCHKDFYVYTIIGNGEMKEGSVWEALQLAAQWRLDNLTIIVDNNDLQSDGRSADILYYPNILETIASLGLWTERIDGHNETAIHAALSAGTDGCSKVIVADTIKGKGISFMEGNNEWHHNRLILEMYEKAMEEIEG